MQKNSRMINLYEKEYYQEVLKRTSMLKQWIEEKKEDDKRRLSNRYALFCSTGCFR